MRTRACTLLRGVLQRLRRGVGSGLPDARDRGDKEEEGG